MAKGFEEEKAGLLKKVEDEEGKKKLIAYYETKLKDMDILTEALDEKEYELAELMQEHEAVLEYENMVEEMTEEILKKESEIGAW